VWLVPLECKTCGQYRMSVYSGNDGNKENLSCGNDQCIGLFVHLPFVLTFASDGRTLTLPLLLS
jgi:hypothetical protein